MKAIQNSQRLIALAALVYGVLLFGSLGVTAVAFVAFGMLLVGLAVWTARLTVIPVFFSLIVDGVLAWWSWNMLSNTIYSVRVNADYQRREISYDQYITLDSVAALAIFCSAVVFIVTVASQWNELRGRKWL